MKPQQMEVGDVVIVDRRDDIRIIARIPGEFSLSDRRSVNGERRVFPCRAVNLSPYWIALASPVHVKVGERVIAQIDHLGKLEGPVVHVLRHGFMMRIATSGSKRDNIAAKLEWLEDHKNHDAQDRRCAERVIPKNLHSHVILADGSSETCKVLDISVSGAAISAATVPGIGTVLAIGTVVGRVVRHFEGGFAVHFIERKSALSLTG
jgi:hypothetical protein